MPASIFSYLEGCLGFTRLLAVTSNFFEVLQADSFRLYELFLGNVHNQHQQ